MKIKLKRLSPNAVVPSQAYDGDFCYDLYATSVEEILPGVYKYGIGWAMEIVRDEVYVGDSSSNGFMPMLGNEYEMEYSVPFKFPINNLKISIDIRPRSSIYKTGLILCNSPGTVDEKYRNEIFCIFRQVDKNLPIYNVGDKIAQMKIGFTVPIEFNITEDLDNGGDRGLKGFGSSDVVGENVSYVIDGINRTFFIKDGWMLNPNEKVVRGIIKGLDRGDGKCPCIHPKDDGDLICPCESYRLRDKCCCNLYVKKQ